MDPKGASAWLTVGLHLVRVGSILSLLLAHAWLGVYLFRMGQPLVGLGPESVQEEAKDLKRFVKGSAQRAEQAAKSKDD